MCQRLSCFRVVSASIFVCIYKMLYDVKKNCNKSFFNVNLCVNYFVCYILLFKNSSIICRFLLLFIADMYGKYCKLKFENKILNNYIFSMTL